MPRRLRLKQSDKEKSGILGHSRSRERLLDLEKARLASQMCTHACVFSLLDCILSSFVYLILLQSTNSRTISIHTELKPSVTYFRYQSSRLERFWADSIGLA